MEILDTSGYYQFPAMKELSIREGTAFILVFDLSKESSLNSLISLREKILEIKQKHGKGEKVHMILVGNKLDRLDPFRANNIVERAKSLAYDLFKCLFVEISAKNSTKEQISKIFTTVAELISKEIEDQLNLIKLNSRRNSTISIGRRFSIARRDSCRIDPSLLQRRFSEPFAGDLITQSLGQGAQTKNSNTNLDSHASLAKHNKNCVIS